MRRFQPIALTPTASGDYRDPWGNRWGYINSYFGDRRPCEGCGCEDFSGWRCEETGEVLCFDCGQVPPGAASRTLSSRQR